MPFVVISFFGQREAKLIEHGARLLSKKNEPQRVEFRLEQRFKLARAGPYDRHRVFSMPSVFVLLAELLLGALFVGSMFALSFSGHSPQAHRVARKPPTQAGRDEAHIAETLAGVRKRFAETSSPLRARRSDPASPSPTNPNATEPPSPPLANPDPNPVPIPPNACTFTLGHTYTATAGASVSFYTNLVEQSFRAAQHLINARGGVNIGGQQCYLEVESYNDGADCSTAIILYEKMASSRLADILANPLMDCPEVSIVAEIYGIPIINADDAMLSVYMDQKGSGFDQLFYTFDLTSNYWTAPQACVEPAANAGARTYAVVYEAGVVQLAQAGELGAQTLGMKPALNATMLSLADQLTAVSSGNPCSYFAPTIDAVIAADADLLMMSMTDATQSGVFVDCMHRRRYQPRAFWTIAGASFPDPVNDAWQLYGTMNVANWPLPANFSDPMFGSAYQFYDEFLTVFPNTSNIIMASGFPALHATALTVALLAAKRAGSFDHIAVAQQLRAIDDQTMIGHLSLIPGTRHYDSPFYCTQTRTAVNGTEDVVYPPEQTFSHNLTYPIAFSEIVTALYLYSPYQRIISTGAWVGIAIAILVAVALIAAAITLGVVKYHNEIVFLPKASSGDWAPPTN